MDSRLSIHLYQPTLEGVSTQFALVRFALQKLSKARIKKFYHARVDAMEAGLAAYLRRLDPETMPGGHEFAKVKDGADAVLRHSRKDASKQSRPSDARFKKELSEDRLNQSELLLLVAHFESFLKEIHRTFLLADPVRVFGKSEKEVKLNEIFPSDAHPAPPFDKFLNETVIREIKKLDSQRIEQKADYFQKHFGVVFGTDDDMKDLKSLLEMRNQISHEIYKRPAESLEQISDQHIVSEQMLGKARWLFYEVPRRCIEVGARDYPAHFRSINVTGA